MKIFVRDKTLRSIHYFAEADNYATVGNEEEITDIETVERIGLLLVNPQTKGWRDKKNVRDKLKTLIFTKMGVAVAADNENDTKFALLSASEQDIALNWFIAGKESWQLAINADDLFWTQKAVEFREWTTKVRKQRVQRLESLIFRRMLNLEEAKDVLLDMWQVLEGTPIPLDAENKTTTKIRVKNLKDLFIDGIEGTLEDNARNFVFESLADYIDSRPGTKFANNGFRNLTYTFRTGHTKDTVADELMDIKDGKW